jgi:glycosyltransferase involved in cell wall biosynthesis
MSRSFVLVTDLPTPYRNHSYNVLSEAMKERGIDFRVLFMAEKLPGRHPSVNLGEIRFPYRVAKGIGIAYENEFYHFNPSIVTEVLRTKPDWVMLGGSWNMPTTLALMSFKRFFRNVNWIVWAEANRDSMVRRTGPVAALRRKVWSSADALGVPGQVARETVSEVCGREDIKFLPFPNLVDKERFGERVLVHRRRRAEARREKGLGDAHRVLFWSARLNEPLKGIVNFLSAIKPVLKPGTRIMIAGEGPHRAWMESWIRDARLDSQVTLLGQQREDQVLEWLGIADAVLLPSLRDPNPLSVIEGLWAQLPLLISDHCGNFPETIEEGGNGWVVDPENPASMAKAFAELQAASDETLARYGRRSREIAEERFDSIAAMRRFVAAVEAM